MKRRWKRRTSAAAGGDGPGHVAGRAHPMRRRLLMIATVGVAGLIVVLLSKGTTESGDAEVDGTVTLDGRPFGGATMDFRGEDRPVAPSTGQGKARSTGISRYLSPGHTDADGRYHIKLRPGPGYTISIRRTDIGKDPLPGPNGRLPTAEVGPGHHRLDIPLVSR